MTEPVLGFRQHALVTFDLGEGGLAQDWQKEQISWAP